MGEWTLLSNHGHVLVCLANNHKARLRDVAAEVGITERAVQNILRELQDCGMVQVSKHGRCNHYQINTRKSLRHSLESHCTVGKLLQLLKSEAPEESGFGHNGPEASKAGKKQTATEPGKTAASASSATMAQAQTETSAPAAKAVAPGKPPADLPTRQATETGTTNPTKAENTTKPSQQSVKKPAEAVPARKGAEKPKSEKKDGKDKKKKIPASDQQGSLF